MDTTDNYSTGDCRRCGAACEQWARLCDACADADKAARLAAPADTTRRCIHCGAFKAAPEHGSERDCARRNRWLFGA